MPEFPWIKWYPAGVSWDAELPAAPVPRILDDTAAKWPDHPALDFMGRKISYREFQQFVNRAAKGFQQLGVKPGVHVGLYLPNTPHHVISFFRGAEGRRHGGQLLAARCRKSIGA
jgi:long-chain acyl-CoA synthetase